MNDYLVCVYQKGGCDYTIGCGISTSLVNFDPDNLEEELNQWLLDNITYLDTSIYRVDCYLVKGNLTLLSNELDKLFKEQKQDEPVSSEIWKKHVDYVEYLRLKEKFEKDD